jgi:hypothetical protein
MGWSRARETARDRWVTDWNTRCQQEVGSGEAIHHRDGAHGIEVRRQCKRRATRVIVVEGNPAEMNDRACWQHAPKMQDHRVARVMDSLRVTVEEVQR